MRLNSKRVGSDVGAYSTNITKRFKPLGSLEEVGHIQLCALAMRLNGTDQTKVYLWIKLETCLTQAVPAAWVSPIARLQS
jgi:hypothetical protein